MPSAKFRGRLTRLAEIRDGRTGTLNRPSISARLRIEGRRSATNVTSVPVRLQDLLERTE